MKRSRTLRVFVFSSKGPKNIKAQTQGKTSSQDKPQPCHLGSGCCCPLGICHCPHPQDWLFCEQITHMLSRMLSETLATVLPGHRGSPVFLRMIEMAFLMCLVWSLTSSMSVPSVTSALGWRALLQKTLLDVSTKDDTALGGKQQFPEVLLIRKHVVTSGKHGSVADPVFLLVSVEDFVDFVLLLSNFHFPCFVTVHCR